MLIIQVMATTPEALAIATQHHQAGRLQAAEQIYRQIIQVQPNQPDALHLLGVIAGQVGKYEVAVEYIRRAIGLKGNVAAFHNNLGNALKEQGKLDEAVACYRRALELQPDFADAQNNLGNSFKGQGKLDEAIACYQRALDLKPDYALAHYNLGVALQDQEKLDESLACCRRALELQPDFAEAHNNVGVAFKDQGKLDKAVACYRRALELKPDVAETHNNLGAVFKDLGKLDKAVACYRRALELKPDFAGAHCNLGKALREQGKLDEALACCRRALELKPDFAEAHGSLGNILREIGDLQRAEDSFRTALRHDPRSAFAHYKLAELLGGKLPEEDLAAQRRLLERASASGEQGELTDSQQMLLHFGLAQVLDARGEYAQAAEHLDRANALQLAEGRKCGQEYYPNEHELFITRTIGVCTPNFFERVRGFGLESEIPVFVVGLPRSGTTLIEQILASHSQFFGAGEIPLAGDTLAAVRGQGLDSIEGLRQLEHEAVHRLASRHLARLHALNPAALRVVDKTPDNYLLLGLLASLFPRAKFIHCRRDLRDVAVSCWMTHFREIRWANDQQHIASRFHAYQRIMAHWRAVLPVPLLEVDYEETVGNLEGVARRLVAWCGLEWEPKCLEFYGAKRPVRTASTVQVRQPVYGTSVGRWKHYEYALAPLFARLERGSDLSHP